MTTWITKKDGKVNRVMQSAKTTSPGPEWSKVSNDWGGAPGDDLSWFDAFMRRRPDTELVTTEKRVDNRGKWFSKDNPGETRLVYELDENIGRNWTKKAPLPDEPFQRWDDDEGQWVTDTASKIKTKKEQTIVEKKSAIQSAEQRIQRSLIALQSGMATEEDKKFFSKINNEIISLRQALKEIER
jgi:hypothetical protein